MPLRAEKSRSALAAIADLVMPCSDGERDFFQAFECNGDRDVKKTKTGT